MTEYAKFESFIPSHRDAIIDLCIQDGKLTDEQALKFKRFCEILSAYYHFDFHRMLEVLKKNYAPFNPDTDAQLCPTLDPPEIATMKANLIETFEKVLQRANYTALNDAALQQSLEHESLVALKTQVDFDDFDKIIFYHRGNTVRTITTRKLFGQAEHAIEVFERVVLLIKFKDTDQAQAQDHQTDSGKIHIYLYKNIPKNDLELLFPNIKISMTWKDRFLFAIPALGAGISVIFKALPNILLIAGVILSFVLGPSVAKRLGVNQNDVDNILPILAALLSIVITLGSVAFRQYTVYKNKRLEFLKTVADTLFFRNLGSNTSVFHVVIDDAEEEECKEIILVYYHLVTHNGPLTPKQLDIKIEEWIARKYRVKIDFDIDQTLCQLEALGGKIIREGDDTPTEVALLTRDDHGVCHVLPLDEAMTVIDQVWDDVFQYSHRVLV
ncbi:MAG: DUF3754 domain-containing protein [Proteobacteria bacterium]|nr:DUF3754 domain-containing protein [Pseudomonadota bacterium]